VIVVTTKKVTPTGVRYDINKVMSKESKVRSRGPISKGLNKHVEIATMGVITL
jgi:hypothetical protein